MKMNSVKLDFEVRVPDEIPMVVFTSRLPTPMMDFRKLVMLANDWNEKFPVGHFEVGVDPRTGESSLSFVQWKHLTNDLRLYAVDYVLKNLGEAAATAASTSSASSATAAAAAQTPTPKHPDLRRAVA
ncbi:MAG: hypothetical protein V4692_14340 [Bdellovibrionota bacterium]